MMIDLMGFTGVVADSFFDGNISTAGLAIYAVLVMVIFAVLSRYSLAAALIAVLPVTIIYSLLGTLSGDLMILILIVDILGLGVYARIGFSWDPLTGRDQWGRRVK